MHLPYESKIPKLIRLLARLLIPLAVAFTLVTCEKTLTTLTHHRPGLLIVAMIVLLGGLLTASTRRMLIITLCFGISFLALRDAYYAVPPPQIDYVIVFAAYPFMWAAVAILAAISGALEAIYPGSVWVRRCYFAAASLYLTGHGLLGLMLRRNWDSLVLLVTGIGAAAGVFFAHQIVNAENEDAAPQETDPTLSEETARRAAVVAAREWKETPEEIPGSGQPAG